METRIQLALAEFEPGSTLLKTWSLGGGISAQMTAFEIARTDGTTASMIARQHGDWTLKYDPARADREFAILQQVRAFGIPAPRAYFIENRTSDTACPLLILEYIHGAPEMFPGDVHGYLKNYASQLAAIHAVDLARFDTTLLRREQGGANRRREVMNADLREPEMIEPGVVRPRSHFDQLVAIFHASAVWRSGAKA